MTARESPAAQTAFGPMVLAAVEQNEPPQRRLVHDDLAPALLPFHLRTLAAATRFRPLRRLLVGATERAGPGLWANLACRKRFIDERLDEAVAGLDAVVVLGAGMDSRACRLARRSDLPVFEVDLPVNIARKRAAVQRAIGSEPASVRLVPLDFERGDLIASLAVHEYRTEARTFVVWEGVTLYLSEEAVHATLRALESLPPGSRLVFTYVQRAFIDGSNMYDAAMLYDRFRRRRQIWHFGLEPEKAAEFVGGHGWRLTEQAGPDYYLRNYIRPAGRALAASDLEWTALAEKV